MMNGADQADWITLGRAQRFRRLDRVGCRHGSAARVS
jgi:hypothetical protein